MTEYITSAYNWLTRTAPRPVCKWLIRPLSDSDFLPMLAACAYQDDNDSCRIWVKHGQQLLDERGLGKDDAFEVLLKRGEVTMYEIADAFAFPYCPCPDHVFRLLTEKSEDGQPEFGTWLEPLTKCKFQLLAACNCDLNRNTPFGPLISWTHVKSVEILDQLIELGFDVHVVHDGGNLLHSVRDKAVIQRLIELGVDLEARDKNGLTPVHTNYCLCKLLEPGMVDPNITDCDGNSLLQYFFLQESYDCLEIALKLGVDVNHQNNRGETILHQLTNYIYQDSDYTYYDKPEMKKILNMLLEAGADVTLETKPRSAESDVRKFQQECPEDTD